MNNNWELIYREHHDVLLKNLLARTDGNEPEAEDILGMTFLRLMEDYPSGLTHVENIGGYLQKSAINLLIDRYRRDTKHGDKRTDEVGMDDQEWVSHENVEDDSLNRIELSHLKSRIDRLPNEFKDVIDLLVDGYTYEQIAESLSIEVGTVKSRIYRAKMKIGR